MEQYHVLSPDLFGIPDRRHPPVDCFEYEIMDENNEPYVVNAICINHTKNSVGKRSTKEKEIEAIRLYKEGVPINDIRNDLRLGWVKMKDIIKRHGLLIRPRGGFRTNSGRKARS